MNYINRLKNYKLLISIAIVCLSGIKPLQARSWYVSTAYKTPCSNCGNARGYTYWINPNSGFAYNNVRGARDEADGNTWTYEPADISASSLPYSPIKPYGSIQNGLGTKDYPWTLEFALSNPPIPGIITYPSNISLTFVNQTITYTEPGSSSVTVTFTSTPTTLSFPNGVTVNYPKGVPNNPNSSNFGDIARNMKPGNANSYDRWIQPGDTIWVSADHGPYKGYTEPIFVDNRNPNSCNNCTPAKYCAECFQNVSVNSNQLFNATSTKQPPTSPNCTDKYGYDLHLPDYFDFPRLYTSLLTSDNKDNPIVIRGYSEGTGTTDYRAEIDINPNSDAYSNWGLLCLISSKDRSIPDNGNYPSKGLVISGNNTIFWDLDINNSDLKHFDDRIKHYKYNLGNSPDLYVNELWPTDGIHIATSKGTKLINVVVRNTSSVGIDAFSYAEATEINGCIIYNNGNSNTETGIGHGHGIYTGNKFHKDIFQNGACEDQIKVIKNCFLFNQFARGIEVYKTSSVDGPLLYYQIENNVAFCNGSLYPNTKSVQVGKILIYPNPCNMNPLQYISNYYFESHAGMGNMNFINNHGYYPTTNGGSQNLGIGNTGEGIRSPMINFNISDNYLIGGTPLHITGTLMYSQVKNNHLHSNENLFRYTDDLAGFPSSKVSVYHTTPPCVSCKIVANDYFPESDGRSGATTISKHFYKLDWDYNTYSTKCTTNCATYKPSYFSFNGSVGYLKLRSAPPVPALVWSSLPIFWDEFGFDLNSTFQDNGAASPINVAKSFINPITLNLPTQNVDLGLANIVIYDLNHTANTGFNLDISSVVPIGNDYRIRDVQNMFNLDYIKTSPPGVGFDGNPVPVNLHSRLGSGSGVNQVEQPNPNNVCIKTVGARRILHTPSEFNAYLLEYAPAIPPIVKNSITITTGSGHGWHLSIGGPIPVGYRKYHWYALTTPTTIGGSPIITELGLGDEIDIDALDIPYCGEIIFETEYHRLKGRVKTTFSPPQMVLNSPNSPTQVICTNTSIVIDPVIEPGFSYDIFQGSLTNLVYTISSSLPGAYTTPLLTAFPEVYYVKSYITNSPTTLAGAKCYLDMKTINISQLSIPSLQIIHNGPITITSSNPNVLLEIKPSLIGSFQPGSYQWFDKNGNLIGTGISITVNAKGEYHLEGIDYCNNTAISNDIRIVDCSNPPSSIISGSTIVEDYANDFSFNSGITNLPPTGSYIMGDIWVRNGATLNLTGINVYMEEGKTIVVDPGGTLMISSSQIHGCGNWQGIEVSSTSSNKGIIQFTNPTITDAKVGLWASQNSDVNVNGGIFENNEMHMTFTSSGSLPPKLNFISNVTFGKLSQNSMTFKFGINNPGFAKMVYLDNCGYVNFTGNTFIGQLYFKPINGIEGYNLRGSNKHLFTGNNFSDFLYEGLHLENSENIDIQSNYFGNPGISPASLLFGAILKNVEITDVHDNIFSRCIYGLQFYNNLGINGSKNYIYNNLFEFCTSNLSKGTGLLISTDVDPFLFNVVNSHSNTINMEFSCNAFTYNDFGVVGTADIIPQLPYGYDPGNSFNSNSFDIFWTGATLTYNSTAITCSSVILPFSLDNISAPTCSILTYPTYAVPNYCGHGGGPPANKRSNAIQKQETTFSDLKITAFPNPFNSELNVTIEGSEKTTYLMTAYDMLGRRLLTESLGSNQTNTVDTKTWAAGPYELRFTNEKGDVILKRVVSVK